MKQLLIVFALMFAGCDYEYVDDLMAVKRIENTAKCSDGCTVVTGDSNVYWYNWNFIPGNVCNLGIGGQRISFVVNQIDDIAAMNPIRVIIWIGQNNYTMSTDEVHAEYDKLFVAIKKLSCPVYIMSVHPYYCGRDNGPMIAMNDYLRLNADKGYTFIDIYDDIELCGRRCYFNTGHLSATGFEMIKSRVLESI